MEICNTATANLRAKTLDFGGFDSSIIGVELTRPIGNFPESLSQAILIGTILLGRSGVIPLTRLWRIRMRTGDILTLQVKRTRQRDILSP